MSQYGDVQPLVPESSNVRVWRESDESRTAPNRPESARQRTLGLETDCPNTLAPVPAGSPEFRACPRDGHVDGSI